MLWIIFSFISCISTAILTVLTKLSVQYLDPLVVTAVQTFITSFALIIVILYSKTALTCTHITMHSFLIITLGIIANIFSYVFFTYAMKYGSVVHVSSIYLLNFPLTIFISGLILNEVINFKVILGTTLMLAGAFLLSM